MIRPRTPIPVAVVAAAAFMVLAGLAVADSPVHVDEPAVCLACHPDLEAQMTRGHVHAVFEMGECSSCHNPHASKHADLLTADQKSLCLGCHDSVGPELQLPSTHAPARNGECGACHAPHASDHPHQLRMSKGDLCASCHAQVATWSSRAVPHAPVDDGDCLTCHDPHGSEQPKLLGSAVPGLCFECHERSAKFRAAHAERDISDSDCTACHDPHASSQANLLYENQHAPFRGENCSTCHGDMDTSTAAPFAIGDGIQDLCLRCHRGVADYREQTYQHIMPEPRSCDECHNPHASNSGDLLAAPQSQLCMRCHFNEADRNKPKAEYVTHDGMDCSECHTPHGGQNPRYLRVEGGTICAGCHEDAHQVSHPLGEDVIDPRTGEAVTCLSCHQLHGADFANYLPLDPDMDLCIQCHKR